MFMLRAVCVLLFILALHESVDAEVYAPGHRPITSWGCQDGTCYTYCEPFFFASKCGSCK